MLDDNEKNIQNMDNNEFIKDNKNEENIPVIPPDIDGNPVEENEQDQATIAFEIIDENKVHEELGEEPAQSEENESDRLLEEKMQKRKKIDRWITRGILIVSIIGLIFSATKIIIYFAESKEAKDTKKGIIDRLPTPIADDPTFDTNNASKKTSPPTPRSFPDIAEAIRVLQAENKDSIGWINIPGTLVDYPVVRGQDNEFYLDHDIKGKKAKHGTIFMDFRNNVPLDENTIIYGHNMKDKQMFGDLQKYLKASYYNQYNSTIYLFTSEGVTKWKIFSVYTTTTDFYYIVPTFDGDINYQQRYIDEIRARSLIDCDIDVQPTDKILTLSTCDYTYKNGRLAVHARLLRDDEDPERGTFTQRDTKTMEKRKDNWRELYNKEKNG